MRPGAQAVPLNPAYTASELGPILADAACKVIVCDFNVEPIVQAADVDRAALRIVVGSRRRTTNPLEGRGEMGTSASGA